MAEMRNAYEFQPENLMEKTTGKPRFVGHDWALDYKM
jgi:hypothetical protein